MTFHAHQQPLQPLQHLPSDSLTLDNVHTIFTTNIIRFFKTDPTNCQYAAGISSIIFPNNIILSNAIVILKETVEQLNLQHQVYMARHNKSNQHRNFHPQQMSYNAPVFYQNQRFHGNPQGKNSPEFGKLASYRNILYKCFEIYVKKHKQPKPVQGKEEENDDQSKGKKLKKSTTGIEFSKEEVIQIVDCICTSCFEDGKILLKDFNKTFAFTNYSAEIVDFFCRRLKDKNITYQWISYVTSSKALFDHLNDITFIEPLAFFGPIHDFKFVKQCNGKSDDFVERAVIKIKELEELMTQESLYKKRSHSWSNGTTSPLRFTIFHSNMLQLMKGFRGIHSLEKIQIPVNTACAQFNRYVRKRYVIKDIDDYQLNDVIYAMMCLVPSSKKIFLSRLEKYVSRDAYQYWSQLQLPNCRCPPFFPLPDRDEDSLYVDDGTYLALQKETKVLFCNTPDLVRHATQVLSVANLEEAFNVCGFDCEWSSFHFPERVTIIQVAFKGTVYIIDCTFVDIDNVQEFLNALFSAKNIMKLGMKPHGDLSMLLLSFPKLNALYEPAHTFCISELIVKINDALLTSPFIPDDKKEICARDGNLSIFLSKYKIISEMPEEKIVDEEREVPDCVLEAEKEGIDNEEDGRSEEVETGGSSPALNQLDEVLSTAGEPPKKPGKKGKNGKEKGVRKNNSPILTPKAKFNKVMTTTGLSKICDIILGRGLKKTEQCSVWLRRPLRVSQARYAALDAECTRLIYLECEKYCQELGLDCEKITRSISTNVVAKSKFFDYF